MVHTKIMQPIGCTSKKMVAHYFLWILGIPRVLGNNATNATNIRVFFILVKKGKSTLVSIGFIWTSMDKRGIYKVYEKC